jgi:hypothetical protein
MYLSISNGKKFVHIYVVKKQHSDAKQQISYVLTSTISDLAFRGHIHVL